MERRAAEGKRRKMEGEDFSVEAKSLTFRASPSPPVGSQRDSVRPQQQPYFHHFTLPDVLNSPCTFQQEKKNKTNCRKNVSSQLPSEPARARFTTRAHASFFCKPPKRKSPARNTLALTDCQQLLKPLHKNALRRADKSRAAHQV